MLGPLATRGLLPSPPLLPRKQGEVECARRSAALRRRHWACSAPGAGPGGGADAASRAGRPSRPPRHRWRLRLPRAAGGASPSAAAAAAAAQVARAARGAQHGSARRRAPRRPQARARGGNRPSGAAGAAAAAAFPARPAAPGARRSPQQPAGARRSPEPAEPGKPGRGRCARCARRGRRAGRRALASGSRLSPAALAPAPRRHHLSRGRAQTTKAEDAAVGQGQDLALKPGGGALASPRTEELSLAASACSRRGNPAPRRSVSCLGRAAGARRIPLGVVLLLATGGGCSSAAPGRGRTAIAPGPLTRKTAEPGAGGRG